jgi:C1A family cysteine protease
MKRGTGWIPDYPDLSDYTLEKDSEKLSEQVQSQGSTASIESLAQKICNALDILAQQANESNREALRKVKEDLEAEVLDGVGFTTVDVYYDLKKGDSGSEVRLIKRCLQTLQQSSKKIRILQPPYGEQLRKYITDVELTRGEIYTAKRLVDVQLWYVNQYKKYSSEDSVIDLGALLCLLSLSSTVRVELGTNWQPAEFNLQIAKDWSDFSKKFPEEFQKLIQTEEDLLRNLNIFSPGKEPETLPDLDPSDAYEANTQLFERTYKANTQLFAHTQFVVRLYDFWYDLKELVGSCNNFGQQFCGVCKIFVGEIQPIKNRQQRLSAELDAIQVDLQSIKNRQQRLSAELDAIQVAKDSLDKFEVPLYQGGKAEYLGEYLSENECLSENEIEQELEDLKRPFTDKINLVKKSLIHLEGALNQIQLQIETMILQLEAPEITSERWIQLIKNFEIEVLALSNPFSNWDPENLPFHWKPHDSVQEMIQHLSEVHLPQISPQLMGIKEISVETPIHSDLFKLIGKELTVEELPQSIIKPIVEVVAQMLMPLGQYSGLSEATSKALNKISCLVGQEDKNLEHESSSSSQKTLLALQKMFQETIEQHNNSLIKKDIMPLGDSSLRPMTLSALKRIATNLGSLKEPPVSYSLTELIKKIPENLEKLLQKKQPFFWIRSEKIFRIKSKEGEASKEGKQIQFLISQKLREEHSEIQAQLNGVTNIFSAQKDEAPAQKELEKQPDVYLTLPEFVDLSYWFSSIEDQGSLNSCTAYAGIALLEYAQHKSSGTYVDASPLFLYKVTRNLLQQTGDVGASMRDTMKAMTAFGVCPEAYWTYDETQFDHDPPAFCYSFAESYKALKYFRLDHGNIDRSVLLAQIKVLLVSEIPCAFGFTLYDSAYEESNFAMGHLPLPTNRDKVIGGHVVVAVGYHDRKIIKNSNGDEFEGALLIRNSWGRGWGQGGYGWMPYEYVLKGLTADWWSLLKAEWLASGNFGAGASAWDSDQGGDGRKGRRQ